MDLIVDIQYFKINNNVTVPKEVAVLALDGDFSAHWVVLPQNSLDKISREAKKQNNWLTQFHHGLDYYDGEVSLRVLKNSLCDILKKSRKIYVRGNEKWETLHKLTFREIINLEYDNDCPPFDKLLSENYCLNHALKPNFKKYRCALNNAHRIKSWLISEKEKKNEYNGNIEESVADNITHCRCLPGRSSSMGVDETDSNGD